MLDARGSDFDGAEEVVATAALADSFATHPILLPREGTRIKHAYWNDTYIQYCKFIQSCLHAIVCTMI
jgi:hypothetical protein